MSTEKQQQEQDIKFSFKSTSQDILLITANVGTLFEKVFLFLFINYLFLNLFF